MLLPLAAATAAPPCRGVALPTMIERYAALTQAQDVAALARLYGRDGVLVGPAGAPISGAGEVARFLADFASYHVIEDRLTVDAVAPQGGGWRVEGGFHQRGTAPDGTGFTAAGRYRADWACGAAGWRVVRMATFPGEAVAR